MRAPILIFALILNGVLLSQIVTAQRINCENDWCWGNEPRKAKEKYALFADGLPLRDFKRSEVAFDWLVGNVPQLNKDLYIKGEWLCEALIEYEKRQGENQVTIEKYNNKIQEIKKLRDKYFPG